MTAEPMDIVVRLGVAALGGLAVGIEREWSVKRGRHTPHFAGTRTFLLLGLIGALGVELCRSGLMAAGTALLLAGAALIVVAYLLTSKGGPDVGGTTEVAALVVLTAGALAGMGRLALASGLFAFTTLVLAEKGRLHAFVERIEPPELMAAARFAVLALVIFPLLPIGPLGPGPGIRPQELWMLVLLFSGLSFASFVALRLVGLHRGYGLVGLLGGLISSTAATLNFSRESREQPSRGRLLALGVVAACTILPLRVLLLSAALNTALALAVLPYLVPPLAVGFALTALIMRQNDPQATTATTPSNPLRFGAALQMTAAFQLALYLVGWLGSRFGSSGTLASAAAVGLTDVDALIYSMFRLGGASVGVALAGRALAVAVLSNTLFKLGLAVGVGRGPFRRFAAVNLGLLSAASVAALFLF